MSKGFYKYAREKIKIKKEKELILESESTDRTDKSIIQIVSYVFFNKLYLL
jgi:hypothetical protein